MLGFSYRYFWIFTVFVVKIMNFVCFYFASYTARPIHTHYLPNSGVFRVFSSLYVHCSQISYMQRVVRPLQTAFSMTDTCKYASTCCSCLSKVVSSPSILFWFNGSDWLPEKKVNSHRALTVRFFLCQFHFMPYMLVLFFQDLNSLSIFLPPIF